MYTQRPFRNSSLPPTNSHWLHVLVPQCQTVGVAKLPQHLPRGLLPPSLDEQRVEEQEALQREAIVLDTRGDVACHDDLHVLQGLGLEGGIETSDLGEGGERDM